MEVSAACFSRGLDTLCHSGDCRLDARLLTFSTYCYYGVQYGVLKSYSEVVGGGGANRRWLVRVKILEKAHALSMYMYRHKLSAIFDFSRAHLRPPWLFDSLAIQEPLSDMLACARVDGST